MSHSNKHLVMLPMHDPDPEQMKRAWSKYRYDLVSEWAMREDTWLLYDEALPLLFASSPSMGILTTLAYQGTDVEQLKRDFRKAGLTGTLRIQSDGGVETPEEWRVRPQDFLAYLRRTNFEFRYPEFAVAIEQAKGPADVPVPGATIRDGAAVLELVRKVLSSKYDPTLIHAALFAICEFWLPFVEGENAPNSKVIKKKIGEHFPELRDDPKLDLIERLIAPGDAPRRSQGISKRARSK